MHEGIGGSNLFPNICHRHRSTEQVSLTPEDPPRSLRRSLVTKAHLAPTLQGREEAAPRPASPQPLPHARGRSATSCWLRFSVCLGVRSLLGRSCRKRLVSMGTALGVGERGTKTELTATPQLSCGQLRKRQLNSLEVALPQDLSEEEVMSKL